jgi:hypothetical protein
VPSTAKQSGFFAEANPFIGAPVLRDRACDACTDILVWSRRIKDADPDHACERHIENPAAIGVDLGNASGYVL